VKASTSDPRGMTRRRVRVRPNLILDGLEQLVPDESSLSRDQTDAEADLARNQTWSNVRICRMRAVGQTGIRLRDGMDQSIERRAASA